MALPLKRRLFVTYYLGKAQGNGALAARLAGYGSPEVEACRLLKNANVRAAIDGKLDKAAMDADEVLGRLSALARTDMGDFLSPPVDPSEPPGLDFAKAKRLDKLGVIRKLKRTSRVIPNGKGQPPDVETTVEIELHDPHKALGLLAKHHGLLMADADPEDLTKKSDEELVEIARNKGRRRD